MKTARLFAWILTLALFLGCAAFPAGAEDELKLLSIVSIEGDTVWMHTSAGLAPFAKDGKQTGKAILPGADCYAIGADSTFYYSLEGNIIKADSAGNELAKWETPLESLTEILSTDTHIIFLSDDAYGSVCIEDGAAQTISSEKLAYYGDISPYDSTSFILSDGNGVSVIDSATLNEIDGNYLSAHTNIARSSADEGFYLYNSGNIHFLDALHGETVSYAKLPDNSFIDDVKLGDDGIYAIYKGALCVYPLPTESVEEKTLTIVGGTQAEYDDRMTETIKIFEERHPEYTVKLTSYPQMAKLRTALMANEPGYDILYVPMTDAVAPLKMSGLVMDLSENTVIGENIAQWADMPFLYESDGSLYAIPGMVLPMGFVMTRALWDELNLDIDPKTWTWDDFFALADVAREHGLRLTASDSYGLWDVIRAQYEGLYCDLVGGVANYDTDSFRKLAAMWKQLEDEYMIIHGYGASSQVLLSYEYSPLVNMPQMGGLEDDRIYLGMPTLDGETVTPIQMQAYYINKYSEHADAAVELMEIFTSVEIQNWASVGSQFFLPSLENNEYIKFLSDNNVLSMFIFPTEEEMTEWQHYLSTGKFINRFANAEDYLKEPIEKFLADKLTLEEFIAEAQEYADLYLGE